MLKFLNDNQGAIMTLINFSLVVVTIVYVMLTKKLADSSEITIKQSAMEKVNEIEKKETIRKNLIYLLNGELYMNSYYYAFTMYYLINNKNISLKDRINLFIKNNVTSIERTTKAQMITFVKSDIWSKISNECIYYLPNIMNQELIGYYMGVEHSKIFSINGMTKEEFIEYARGQLVSTYKCFDLFDIEVKDLRRDNKYEIEGKLLSIDKSTGSLIEVK